MRYEDLFAKLTKLVEKFNIVATTQIEPYFAIKLWKQVGVSKITEIIIFREDTDLTLTYTFYSWELEADREQQYQEVKELLELGEQILKEAK